jgi:hypothetical protein
MNHLTIEAQEYLRTKNYVSSGSSHIGQEQKDLPCNL